MVVSGDATIKRIDAMIDLTDQIEEGLLTYEVSDEALEIVAGTTKGNANFTLGACTGLSDCPG
jgi:hypothetical protein